MVDADTTFSFVSFFPFSFPFFLGGWGGGGRGVGVRKVSSLLIRSVLGGPGNRYFDRFILSLPLVTFTLDRKKFNHKNCWKKMEAF